MDELKIWTVGHSTRTLSELVDLLDRSRIEVVADVRSYPGSRRVPHFNREALEQSLAEKGIDHVWLKALGGRRRVRPDSPHTVWRNAAFRGYADYMETNEFAEGLAALLKIARKKRTAIMCSEAVWWRCHRSMISDKLKSLGVTVEHIMDRSNITHPYTSAARIVDSELVYGSGDR